MLEIEKTVDLDRDLYKDAVAIREQVFVNEQGIPIEKEMKGEDGPCYYVGYIDGHPVATAQYEVVKSNWEDKLAELTPDWMNMNKMTKEELEARLAKHAQDARDDKSVEISKTFSELNKELGI